MALDPKQISHLLTISESGSFTAAAQTLGMSQPALSNSIALLERRLGVKVLDRNRRGSTLNSYGEILVRRAKGLRALLEQAEQEVHLAAQGIEGPLIIGVTPSVLPKLLPDAFSRLTKSGGRMEVSIIEGVHDHLLEALRAGQVNLVVGPVYGMTDSGSDVEQEVLLDDTFHIAMGLGNTLAKGAAVDLANLVDAPWILPARGSPYSRSIEAQFAAANLPWPADCFTCNALPLIREIVCNTNRISILSRMQLLGVGDGRLQGFKLRGAAPRPLGVKYLRGAGPAPLATAFIGHLREAAAAL